MDYIVIGMLSRSGEAPPFLEGEVKSQTALDKAYIQADLRNSRSVVQIRAVAGCALFMSMLLLSIVSAQDIGCNASEGVCRIVSAAEIVGKIRAGEPVVYDNVFISGDINITRLEKPVVSPIKIVNSTINGSLRINGVEFMGPLNLSGTVFSGDVVARGASFRSDVSFADAHLLRVAEFTLTKFGGVANFVGTNFHGPLSMSYAQFSKVGSFEGAAFWNHADFSNAQFMDDTSFERVHFLRSASFEFARFYQLVSFWRSVFHGEASFANSEFSGTANFMSVRFDENAVFMGSRFSHDVTFSAARFSKSAVFGLAVFQGFSDFSSADFRSVAFFGLAKLEDNTRFVNTTFGGDLVLTSSRIYSMQLENASFSDSSKIYLNEADFNRMLARWSLIKDHLVYDSAAYLALVKNYKNMEWRDDANDCYYQYRRISQSSEPWGLEKMIDVISWLSCGYGVKPSYTIFWSMFMILLFGLVYWIGNGIREIAWENLSDEEVDGEQEKNPEAHEGDSDSVSESRPVRSTERRIPFSDSIFFSAMSFTAQSPASLYPVGIYKHVSMIEGILGWFLLGLFVVVLSGMLIR
ncbi:MAG TPA: pentapeptide repeat-containing protein [Methanothrix sp.]|nr:pentapeptide repeat-containing protein [Methanothrix sp.]HOK57945.1 pentapeptide repeat-containing protein [Methanothrix sp.]HOL43348.1 pentapeptide repeat-containing protein [Methanothrix sp.]HPO88351.1 pentapeptide repeat-containing protein [Methanothrix sp.]